MKRLRARGLVDGLGKGEAIISHTPISFLEGIDPERGIISDKQHELYGKSISGRVLVFPHSVGSSAGAYVIYKLMKNDRAPVAIVNAKSDSVTVSGCAIARIPLVDRVEGYSLIKSGDLLMVNGKDGYVVLED